MPRIQEHSAQTSKASDAAAVKTRMRPAASGHFTMPSFCSACKYSTTSCGGTGPYSEDSSVRICSAGEEYAYEALNLANGQRTGHPRELRSIEGVPVRRKPQEFCVAQAIRSRALEDQFRGRMKLL